MSIKKYLEEIEEKIMYVTDTEDGKVDVWIELSDYEYLKRQAERVEELEKENKQLKADVNAMENEIVHGNKSIEFETYRKCVRGEIDEI